MLVSEKATPNLEDPNAKPCGPNAKPCDPTSSLADQTQPVENSSYWVPWRWGSHWACTFHIVCVNFIPVV